MAIQITLDTLRMSLRHRHRSQKGPRSSVDRHCISIQHSLDESIPNRICPQSSSKISAPQAPLDLTRQPDIGKQQPQQQQGPIEQPPKPNPVEQPKAPAPVAAQPAAVAPPPQPQQPKPTGYAAIAASNTNAAPGIPTNPTHEPPADSFTSIGEWNQVRYLQMQLRARILSRDVNL